MSETPLLVTFLSDGPYRVDEPVELVDSQGRRIEAPDPPVHLCRCGRSATKPFCDGSHARTGWKQDGT